MPRRKTIARKGGRRVRRRMIGSSKLTDFFTKTIPRAAKTVYNKAIKPTGKFLKDSKILSTLSGFIPHPAGKIASAGLNAVGLGRRRKRVGGRRKRVGGRRKRQTGGLSSLTGRLFLT